MRLYGSFVSLIVLYIGICYFIPTLKKACWVAALPPVCHLFLFLFHIFLKFTHGFFKRLKFDMSIHIFCS